MGNRNGKVNVPHVLTTNSRYSDFNTAAVTDNSFVLNALVFTTTTIIVTYRTKDALAKKATWLGLESPVINRLRVFDFTTRPVRHGFRRGNTYPYVIKSRLIESERFFNIGMAHKAKGGKE